MGGFFSLPTPKCGRTIIFKEPVARCILRLCPPRSRAWHSPRLASKASNHYDILPKHTLDQILFFPIFNNSLNKDNRTTDPIKFSITLLNYN